VVPPGGVAGEKEPMAEDVKLADSIWRDIAELADSVASVTLEEIALDDLLVAELAGIPDIAETMRLKPITQSMPYRYLAGDRQAYEDYQRNFGQSHQGPASFQALYDSIREKGYPAGDEYLYVFGDEMVIRDGRHRAAILRYLNGNIEAPVARIRFRGEFPRWQR
jgi:hypothetical protein